MVKNIKVFIRKAEIHGESHRLLQMLDRASPCRHMDRDGMNALQVSVSVCNLPLWSHQSSVLNADWKRSTKILAPCGNLWQPSEIKHLDFSQHIFHINVHSFSLSVCAVWIIQANLFLLVYFSCVYVTV